MQRLTSLLFVTFLVTHVVQAQDRTKYSELIKEAWKLYETKAYLTSAQKYSEAFAALGNKSTVNDRYNAACSWALASQPDSAFAQLFKIAAGGMYTNLGHITTDTDLNSLHNDNRWNTIISHVKTNKAKAEANFDKPLVAMLDTIYQNDQSYRQQMKGVEQKHGWNSDEMKALWKIISEKDSVNLIKVKKILDERGWLGADVIGGKGNATLFLVIQHADLATQQKYLPMMRDAARKGNAQPSSLALLEDRVALGEGKKQIYGSQIGTDPKTGAHYVLPLVDPDNVNKRRTQVGLGTIEEYIANWNMTWDVELYKKQLPEYEALQRR
ncbi:MAG TPA: DUF6624 domain-containing protein [Chryseosolibacter sp.]